MVQTTFLKPLFTITLLFFVCFRINAQDAFIASGGDTSNINGSISYSVGQTLHETLISPSGTVIQGIQISFSSSTLSIIDLETNIDLLAFPNPTSSSINLKFQGDLNNDLNYEMFNLLGQSMLKGKMTDTITKIDISNLPNVTYLLKIIYQKNTIIKTFKIIKN